MTPQERLEALRGAAGECECVGGEDEPLLRRGRPRPVCLDGFEPSAAMDLAPRVKIVVADWFALLGGGMGGDWGRIRDAGRRNVQVWEAALRALGVGAGEVEFLWSSDEVLGRANEYWRPLVMDIAEKHSVERIVRCCKAVFGRDEEQLSAGQYIMQCADVFFYQADMPHGHGSKRGESACERLLRGQWKGQ